MPNRLRVQLGDAWRLLAHGLSGRLLLLTLLYVMVSEVAIFVPSVGRSYTYELGRRIEAAELAILPFTEPSSKELSAGLRQELLMRADANAVILKRADQHELFLVSEMPSHTDVTVNLGTSGVFGGMIRGLDCLIDGDDRVLHIISPTRIKGAETIEVITGEAPIRKELVQFARRLVFEALLISLATAVLVFFSLYLVVVRPIARLVRAMTEFRNNPEDPSRIAMASNRRDEIGRAERELAAMQGELYGFLQQKTRLAALGTAIAKIQHDLRNILSSAQLASDRLAKIDDPVVQRYSTRLIASLDRAVALAANTLRYGRADEHPPVRQIVPLAPVVDEVIAAVLPAEQMEQSRSIVDRIDQAIVVDADPEQLYRLVLNLVRNAAEATGGREVGAIEISARRQWARVDIDVKDNGPGIPEAVRDKLFQPFASSGRPGGSGLGLAIARDIARAHGGDVTLVATAPTGTTFRVTIPDRKAH